ncbi:MAG: glycosyltransferase family 4 protein [Actinobacteria bacterium]|nr:glycosyltransferase family 4 protein [Actinomycetota bacterium]
MQTKEVFALPQIDLRIISMINSDKVVYSVGIPFNYGGIGKIAYYACQALNDKKLLAKVLTTAYKTSEIPASLIESFSLNPFLGKVHNRISNYYVKDSLFDLWASKKVFKARGFYGWSSMSLFTVKQLKKIGVPTLIDRGSTEIKAQKRVLESAFRDEGVKTNVIGEKLLNRIYEEEEIVDFIVFPSSFPKLSYLEEGFSESKLKVNILGVDLKKFKPKEEYNSDKFRVIFVGLLGVRKGVHFLLRAWRKLNLKNAELILIGTIEKYSREIILNELRKTDNAIFLGGVDNPEFKYRECDVFILPSIEDGFGQVVIEAMACGLPVIITENVGAKDCVRNGVDGVVIEPFSIDSICESILFFYNNPDKIQNMGRNGGVQAQNFTWEAYQERFIKLFEEL